MCKVINSNVYSVDSVNSQIDAILNQQVVALLEPNDTDFPITMNILDLPADIFQRLLVHYLTTDAVVRCTKVRTAYPKWGQIVT